MKVITNYLYILPHVNTIYKRVLGKRSYLS